MTDDMIAWLTAQLDAHERNICPDRSDCQTMFHSADENWMLAEIAAKRKRIAHYRQVAAYANPDNRLCMDSAPWEAYVLAEGAARRSLQFDVEVYAARPGWRDEWRP